MTVKVKPQRPTCTEICAKTFEPCTRKAKYYVQINDGPKYPVCGLCARQYVTKALHPLWLKEWDSEVKYG